MLGVNLDANLKFDNHVDKICKKASQKIHALCRTAPYMSFNQKRLILTSFIESQFNYCPLVWMFHSRASNNKINRIHERALRVIYKDKSLSFHQLLEKDNSVSIHQRNLQTLVIEMYKCKHGLSPIFVQNIFKGNESQYNLRHKSDFLRRRIRTVRFGSESLSNIGPQIWDLVPQNIKNSTSLSVFKEKIRKWKIEECPCRLCKKYLPQLGFL